MSVSENSFAQALWKLSLAPNLAPNLAPPCARRCFCKPMVVKPHRFARFHLRAYSPTWRGFTSKPKP